MQYGFLSTNGFRSYPFIDTVSLDDTQESNSADMNDALPESAVVDFGCIFGLDADYEEHSHKVYLYSITRLLGTLYFNFRNNAPGAAHFELVFAVPGGSGAAGDFTVTHAIATVIGSPDVSVSDNCPGDDVTWEGFLETGDVSALMELIPNDLVPMTFPSENYQIEPGRIQNLARAFVRSINLANYGRTIATAPEECGGSISEAQVVYVNTTCMVGELRFKEGYNCAIRQEAATNSLVIAAAVGAGDGRPCDEVPLYDGEESPDNGLLLTGGPRCDEIIKTINGVVGPIVRIIGGDGIDVLPSELQEHTILVSAHMRGFPICVPPPEESSSSESSISL